MPKTALVISGGGSKGAFAVGVLKQLSANFPGIHFDMFIGTSTGSLIAPLAAAGKLDLLEQLYTTVTTDNIILKSNIVARLMGSNSLFDATPLAHLIQQYYTDSLCQQIFQLPQDVILATTCLQTGNSANFSNHATPMLADSEVIQITTPDQLRRAVMASACQPVFMPPIEVDKGKTPIRQYVDGGVREYAGIQLAIDGGAEEIYAILLSPPGDETLEKNFTDAFSILLQTIDIFTKDVGINNLLIPMLYNRALRYIAAVQANMLKAGLTRAQIDGYFDIPFDNPFTGKKPLKIYVIRPKDALDGGVGGLDFDPAKMKAMLALGESRLTEYMASLPPEGDLVV